MTGPLLAWIQKLTVQHFTLKIENLFTKVTTFTHVFRLLLVMSSGSNYVQVSAPYTSHTPLNAHTCAKQGLLLRPTLVALSKQNAL